MRFYLKYGLSVLLLIIICIPYSRSQTGQSDGVTLKLADSDRKIENCISFTTSRSDHENIKAITGQKILVKAGFLLINGDTIEPEAISTRGQSTLYFPRKSFSFSLGSEALFSHGKKRESLKKFNLISLSMDKGYYCNRLAFELMEELKLFGLFYTFCELRINGSSEGIYMVIERPEDWALKKKDSPFIIDRGYSNNIDKLKSGKKTGNEDIKTYRRYFNEIYRGIGRYTGEELYSYLSARLDTEEYMRWLAFNFFIRNGDYTDEVYFYVDPQTKKFRIIPWDYDDLFSAVPHEGNDGSRKELGNKLFFSMEDALDRKIVNDPYLYNKYLIQLREVINQLTEEKLKKVFEKTYSELFPYYSNDEIIKQSIYDLHKNAGLDQLKKDLNSIFNQLIVYRKIFMEYLVSEIK
jgi:spore coat protein H